MTAQKIILVAGIGHSGSTILDLSLGCHPDIVGLGEVSKVLRTPAASLAAGRYDDVTCSCGAAALECAMWGPVIEWLGQHPHSSINTRFAYVMAHFRSLFGSAVIPLDSSKTVRPYQVHLHRHHDLRVIFLARDVRTWTYTRAHKESRTRWQLAWRWYRGNRRTERFLHRHGMPYFALGYEELAAQPRRMLEQLCDWLGVDFDRRMLEPARSNSHIIRGNHLIHDRAGTAHIRRSGPSPEASDARWLQPLMRANRRWVYSRSHGK